MHLRYPAGQIILYSHRADLQRCELSEWIYVPHFVPNNPPHARGRNNMYYKKKSEEKKSNEKMDRRKSEPYRGIRSSIAIKRRPQSNTKTGSGSENVCSIPLIQTDRVGGGSGGEYNVEKKKEVSFISEKKDKIC